MSQATLLQPPQAVRHLLAGYRPGGPYDEMVNASGAIRSHWVPMVNALGECGTHHLSSVYDESQRILRETGVTHTVFGDHHANGRSWVLGPIPILITEEEWTHLERGLAQRLRLFNLILADLYGSQTLLRGGHLPPELILTHPGFLRPCRNIPLTHHSLTLYAADLARGPDGRFILFSDRTQTPLGFGYALENRLTHSRLLPEPLRRFTPRRLVQFSQEFRANLAALAPTPKEDPLTVLLTPGPSSESYFEHAFLANFLGLTLVHGADLTVRGEKVCLKTLDDLHPVDVILRRVEDFQCDPLELEESSPLGVVGLVQAVRSRRVGVANPLGSGIMEHHGLHAYLPGLARIMLQEDLLLPSPATWWCGEPGMRQHVLERLERLIVKTVMPDPREPPVNCTTLNRAGLEALRERIQARPHRYVGQEILTMGTAPVFHEGRIEPRPWLLRTLLTSGPNGISVMPGGLARVSAAADDPSITMQRGGMSKDVWVMAKGGREEVSRIQPVPAFEPTALLGELPSRVAENMYWLGRYAERAEGSIRLLRAILLLLVEETGLTDRQRQYCLHTLLRAFTHITATYPGFAGAGAEERLATPEAELMSAVLDRERVGSIAFTLGAMIQAAFTVRDRLSVDTWRVINEMVERLDRIQRHPVARLSEVLALSGKFINGLMALAGLSMENTTRTQGWTFLDSGRRLERAMFLTKLFSVTVMEVADEPDESAMLELLLTITDSAITYRRRYRSHLDLRRVLELLLQDETIPRSLVFQLAALEEHLGTLPRKRGVGAHFTPQGRIVLEGLSVVRLSEVVQLTVTNGEEKLVRPNLEELLARVDNLLPLLSEAISNSYFQHAQRPKQIQQIYY